MAHSGPLPGLPRGDQGPDQLERRPGAPVLEAALRQRQPRGQVYSSDLGDAGEGAPATGAERVGGHASPGQPPADQGAESLRPPGVLPPRPRLSERSHQALDVKLGSLSGAEGRRGAGAGAAFLGTGFSSLDMSLCVVLYVASSLFLMFMYTSSSGCGPSGGRSSTTTRPCRTRRDRGTAFRKPAAL